MADVPPRMRHGRQSAPIDERPGPIDLDDPPPEREHERERGRERDRERDHRQGPAADRHGAAPADEFENENDDERRLAAVAAWTAVADRRLDRLDTKVERLAVALDQLNSQLNAVLTEMPTRRGINLYLVGGLVGGLAVGLAIMGITIGGLVGGLSSLKPEAAQMAPAGGYASQQPQPIIIQMPPGALGGMPAQMAPSLPAPLPAPAK
ncbi:MAG: hypothetical protein WCJ64_20945 [Rhodospirillaceae bacterium]